MPGDIRATGNDAIAWAEDRIRLLALARQSDDRENRIQSLPRILGAGKPLGEATRRRMESWFGYDLRDVRVHDSRQVAELAQRLGAEAFTVQSHIFGPGEKLNVLTPQGGGLLAHEITHVIQQTEPQRLSPGDWPERVLVPQVKRPTPQPDHRHKYASEAAANLQNENHHHPSSQTLGRFTPSRAKAGQSASPVSLKADGGVVQRAAEVEAQVSEQVVTRALEKEREVASQSAAAASQIDPEEVADKVYHLMLQDLLLERERGAVLD